jgi:hypothetical protein
MASASDFRLCAEAASGKVSGRIFTDELLDCHRRFAFGLAQVGIVTSGNSICRSAVLMGGFRCQILVDYVQRNYLRVKFEMYLQAVIACIFHATCTCMAW